MAYDAAKAAKVIHQHMCNCDKHGYTQGSGRWGSGRKTPCKVTTQGHTFSIPGGDYDCSSSVIKAWQLALAPTKYKGKLQNATYTGNMRSVFTNSGLFTWKPMSFMAKPGDIYLSEVHHTAMCNVNSGTKDYMSEFLVNEFGGITGGKLGDQTGSEGIVHAYRVYSFGWDGILHYNGKANIADKATTATTSNKYTLKQVANFVIEGKAPDGTKFGVQPKRKEQLEAFIKKHKMSFTAAQVQAEVNRLLK